jgi:hypothetical protein
MKELKEHLQEICKCGAEHHVKLAKCHTEVVDRHNARAKHLEVTDPSGSAFHKGEAEWHGAASALHVSHAEKFLATHKAIGEMQTTELQGDGGTSHDIKALHDRFDRLDKIISGGVVPSGVSLFPTTDRPQVIPRYGARNVPSDEARKAMSPELRDIVLPEEREMPAAAIRPGRTD